MFNCGPALSAGLQKSRTRLLLLLLWLPTGMIHALPDDQNQPIHITADKALRDEKKGVTIYSGNVQMRQGSMELEADELTIHHVSEDADKIIAKGNPAKMRQQPELDKGVVHAQANVIEYFKLEERVHLQTDARIEQDGAVVNGDTIDYSIPEQLVKAESNKSGKVIVVIPPSVQKGEDASAPAGSADPVAQPVAPNAGYDDPQNTAPDTEPREIVTPSVTKP